MHDSDKDIPALAADFFVARKGTREGDQKWILKRFCGYTLRHPKPLRLLTVVDIELFIRELREEGYTPGYVAGQISHLRKFFDHLEALGLVQENVARNAFARAEKIEPRVYTDKQLIRVHRKYHPRA
jgi:hypothetical protein